MWSCKIIVGKIKTISEANGIEVFTPYEPGKRFNSEMNKCSYIR
jgi:hypothetical protein